MPNPKRRHSKARRDRRRAHDHLEAPGLSVCPNCHGPAVVVEGAVLAQRELGVAVSLAGVVTRESRRNSRKTTWLPRHRKMKPFPATAPQEKSHVRNWRSKGHLAP